MKRTDNYAIQASQARERFLGYDQQTLIRKLNLNVDADYLYVRLLSQSYRIHRRTGFMERNRNGAWCGADSHGQVMTILDLLCDCREDRFLSGRWKNMSAFGLMFHQNLLEGKRDPWADRFEADAEGFRRACEALGGEPFSTGDIAYAIELFDGLPILIQLWFGDEEFPASLRFLWDENSLMCILLSGLFTT